MIELAAGARYFEDGEVTGIDSLPSGSLGAIFEQKTDSGETAVMLIAMRNVDRHNEGDWNFYLSIDYTDVVSERWDRYCKITKSPINDAEAALRVEEEMTEAFNSLVREIKAGRDLKGIAERYGLEQVDKYEA